MKVLVVGSGGREHALTWKIAQSPLVKEVVCTPGNAGIGEVARLANVAADDLPGLLKLAQDEAADLVVVGPEDPLAAGLADQLRGAGFLVFGPGAEGAKLEASKGFTKELLERHRIPTAVSRTFDRSGQAKGYLEGCTTWPQVIKADGLAAGKGVYICADLAEAKAAVDAIMEEGRHGSAGTKILIEEFLVGEEASLFAITDGDAVLVLEPVQDHKRVGEGDTGPNTGGMGVYSPVKELSHRIYKQIEQHVLLPSIHMLRREEIDFRGVLFIGLMLTEGGPRVIEYNVRFGDPECQALVRRLKSDIVPILLATAKGELGSIETPEWDERTCIGVVAAADGYPKSPRKGDRIDGLTAAESIDTAVVLHAGTKRLRTLDGDDDVVTNGGRVLTITTLGKDMAQARERAYGAYDRIHYAGKFCRRDIGRRTEARSEQKREASRAGAAARRRIDLRRLHLRLGVGICALNEARALPRLLSRLLQVADSRDRTDLVVVADGGSSDGTPDLARRAGATVLSSERGRGRQLRLAGERLLADGCDVLLFLHADCVPRLGSVDALRRAFEQDENLPAAAMRQTIEAEGRSYRWIERAANARARRGMVYGDSGLAVRAPAYRAAGGFDPVLLFEDVALSKRLRRAGRIELVEDATLVISARRWQDEGILRASLRNWMLRGLFEVGVSPTMLARLYRPFRGRPSDVD